MTRRLLLAALVGLLTAAGDRADDPKKSDKSAEDIKKLEGNWKLTRKEYKGNFQPSGFRKEGLFFEDGKIFWTTDGKEAGNQKGTFSIDASASPKTIDVEITRGSNIGKKILGIYEIKDNKLTICWGEPGDEKRPKKFVTKTAVGSGTELENYESLDAKADDKKEPKKTGEKVDAAAEMKKLEGNWKMTREEYRGNLTPGVEDRKRGLFIEDGKIFWTTDGKEAGNQKGTFSIDPSADPKTIDVEITRGSSIGKKLLGIYELKDGKLTVCWGEAGGEKRPKKFVTKTAVGSGIELQTYQKQKD